MKNKITLNKLPLLAFAAMFVTACQTTQTEDVLIDDGSFVDQGQINGQGRASGTATLDGSDTHLTPIVEETMTAQQMLDEPGTPLANRTIYFKFDSAKISDDSLAALEAHGNFVASNGAVKVRLEGHSDERGSREYNIALGDRRAQSVRRVLLFQGASIDQVDTVSYGEEEPAVSGHDELAWSKNRRVELIYTVTQ